MNKYFLKSLRVRVIALSAVLGIVMIVVATFSYRNILETSKESSEILARITQSREVVEEIQENILNAYRATDQFLLEPNNPVYRQQVEGNIDMAVARMSSLQKSSFSQAVLSPEQLFSLQSGIEDLRQRTTQFFDTRSNIAKMYPSVGVASEVMEPNASYVGNAFDMILNARKELDHIRVNDRVFTLWYEAGTRWGKAISSFRLYLANKYGSFNEEALKLQEESVQIHLDKLKPVLMELSQLADEGQLDFEESIALDDIVQGVKEWEQGFEQVLAIHHSGTWREDTRLMRDSIIPSIDRIFQDLQSLENSLNKYDQDTLKMLDASANRQNLMLAGIIGLFLLYAIVLMLFMERMALRPISAVARALKTEAFGKISGDINITPSREIQDLVDAFKELQHQVNTRQEELEFQALHDALTGLPNRKMLEERLEYQLRIAHRDRTTLALLILDLNEFKSVNDALGHYVGDELLVKVGDRIITALRDVDTVARLGGDEFAILLPSNDSKSAEIVARKIIAALDKQITIEGHRLFAKPSIGIAIYPRDGEDYHSLMAHADVAMYTAKRNRSGYAYYDAEHDIHSRGRLSLVNDLRHMLEQGGLELHYQPQISLVDNTVYGAEALLRWNHPERGFIPPDQIVELAEQYGLIEELTYWVMKEAIEDSIKWNKAGYDLVMSVNLSVQCLLGEQLLPRVREFMADSRLKKGSFCLEITESGAMANPVHSQIVLKQLASMGVTLSIDDFGTGLSSLSYLKKLPVQELKIDKSFVIDMEHDESDALIVESTIDLGHNLGLKVVAEGVENLTVLDKLRRAGCDKVQGYHYSRPLNKGDFSSWLAEHYPGIRPALVSQNL